jgi:hypothetical protein
MDCGHNAAKDQARWCFAEGKPAAFKKDRPMKAAAGSMRRAIRQLRTAFPLRPLEQPKQSLRCHWQLEDGGAKRLERVG